MNAEEYSDLKTATYEVESIQHWKANLLLHKIACGTKSGEMLDPLKVENGRDARHVRECIDELGLTRGEAALDACTKDTVKNLAEAEERLSEVESKNFQRLAPSQLGRPKDSARDGRCRTRASQQSE